MRPWSPPLHSQEGSLAEWAQDLLAKIPWVEQSSTTCMELEVCRVAAQRSGKDTDTQEGSLGFVSHCLGFSHCGGQALGQRGFSS